MAVDQLPAQVREFANYLNGLLARLDSSRGWCAVFWQRDPDGMRACLDGREMPPWDVLEALLQDLASALGPAVAAQERERARALHLSAVAAYDARPGGRDALGDRLDVMLREQRYAAERQAELGRSLASAATPQEADAIRLDLAWARDDHERATARCAELRSRLADLDHREAADHAASIRRDRIDAGAFRLDADPLSDESHPKAQAGPTGSRPTDGAGAGGRRPVVREEPGGQRRMGPGGPGGQRPMEQGVSGGRWPMEQGRSGGWNAFGPARDHGAGSSAWDHAPVPAAPGHAPDASAPGHAPAAADGGRLSHASAPGHAPVAADGGRLSHAPASGHVPAAAVGGHVSAPSSGHAMDASAHAPAAPPSGHAPDAPGPGHAPTVLGGGPVSGVSGASQQTVGSAVEHPHGVRAVRGDAVVDVSGQGPSAGVSEPASKQRKRRRGSARFAGMVVQEEAAAVVVPPTAEPVVPVPDAAGRTPRGARFAGAGAAVRRPEPEAVPVDAGAVAEVGRAVESLVRLRAEGRSGEAHALLVEAAHWPPARFPLLAAELQRAGLGADWATLLWEAASLPADRLVAAADALVAAGRTADGEQILRQGVVRPATEIGDAVLALVADGRHREVRALLDAYVRVRTPEEAARSAAPDPQTLAPLLLDAARGVSDERQWDLVHALRVAGFAT
ncbi:hypothetical protein ACYF6T_08675 [Streptomyces sp. 7R007]